MLTPGSRIGAYDIVGSLGAGGMGEVYRATDTKLKRQVAIKILPPSVASDPDRLARFRREAEVLASLNHPNIAAIYGFEEAPAQAGAHVPPDVESGLSLTTCALVMELVEGQDLAQRLGHGPIAFDEALAIAKQIGEALVAAHDQGIIHRDLKPANIKVRPDGTVKVLDFGLAKALDPAGGAGAGGELTQSPTMTSPAMTQPGMILGTAAYMAPEQAKGRAVDRRADVWAFGCVLYETLTGMRAFDGEDVSELIAAVLTREPDWSALPATVPPAVVNTLKRCLQKDRKQRIADMQDVRLALDGAFDTGAAATQTPVAPARGTTARLGWIVAAVLAVAALSLGLLVRSRGASTAAPSEIHLDLLTPPTTQPGDFALSPDASRIVFVATSDGRPRLWLRALDADAPRPLSGTDGASRPFWSADGRSVGFFSDARLKRIDVDSNAVKTLASATYGTGGSWNRDGTILFSPVPGRPVLRVASDGGVGVPVVKAAVADSNGQARPAFLPDGRRFLFRDLRGAWVGSLDGDSPRLLIEGAEPLGHVSSGFLLFLRAGTAGLYAQRFDADRQVLSGTPFSVVEQGLVQAASVSEANAIAYRDATAGGSQLVWFDRAGQELSRIAVSPDAPAVTMPAMSPDGTRLAVGNLRSVRTDLWMLDVRRGVMNAFAAGAGDSVFPVWSPDGKDVIFDSTRDGGVHNLYRKSSNGVGNETLILKTDEDKMPTDWSPDGRYLLYYTFDLRTQNDLWALSLNDGHAFALVQTASEERSGKFSPDGKWIAYVSNESGQFEVYLQPFPGPGAKTRISTAGGAQPQWRRDGKELIYMGLDGRLMGVSLTVPAGGGRQTSPRRRRCSRRVRSEPSSISMDRSTSCHPMANASWSIRRPTIRHRRRSTSF